MATEKKSTRLMSLFKSGKDKDKLPPGMAPGSAAPTKRSAAQQDTAPYRDNVSVSEIVRSASSSAALTPWTLRDASITARPVRHSIDIHRASSASTSNNCDAWPADITDVLKRNLAEIKQALQRLAAVDTRTTIGLTEAAEILCKHLNVSLVSIVAITDAVPSYVLLAAHGAGAEVLERSVVMNGPDWSAPRMLASPSGYLSSNISGAQVVAQLPHDWRAVYQSAGLRSFLAVPIGTEHELRGMLMVAKEADCALDDKWWEPMLGVLSVGLLPALRSEQMQYLCHLQRVLDGTTDHVSLAALLLQGAHKLLLKATNIRMSCRLGLLSTDGQKALVFETYGTPTKDDVEKEGGAGADLHITQIEMEHTLLRDAVTKGKARFVSDCASYLQTSLKPATDIFISGGEMVASIVVLPLMYNGVTLGGIYFTLEVASNFQVIKDLLMGFVNSIVLTLYQKLNGKLQEVWDAVMARPLQPVGSSDAAGGSAPAVMMSTASGPLSVGATSGGAVGKQVFIKRSCTEAMLKVLQHEMRKSSAKASKLEWVTELSLIEAIGKGGFGVVYKGTWKGAVAAVKVMYARQHEREAMKDALEMAVLTSVSHPHIVQVYTCFTDMVEDAGAGANSAAAAATAGPGVNGGGGATPEGGKINLGFRKLMPDEDKVSATCNIVVMEFCDKDSLRQALKKGAFHKRVSSKSVAVDLCAIVQVLIEVSQAIQHLHNMKLIHCDIKPENVLLKTDTSKPIGFITKLSDFGLAKLLRENYYVVNRSGSGTVTHLAPELFQAGSRVTTAVDSFSFGIMMWELYTCQRAYGGLGRDAIIDQVYKKHARPVFPAGVPAVYTSLAIACWDNDQTKRPPFSVIVTRLRSMLVGFQSGSFTGGGAAPPAAAATAGHG